MKLGSALLREKTNVAVKTSTTFNAPGVYIAPYGKTKVRITGRGASGNANSGGNYAGEAYAGSNPGNYAGTNPTTPALFGLTEYAAQNYSGGPSPWSSGPSFTYSGGDPGTSNSSGTFPAGTFPGINVPVNYSYYFTYSVNSYTPASPGNIYYNPGTDYYSPYYNPYYPGSAGTPSNIGGVTFPGGNIATLAPVVPTTTTNISYTPSGLSITVPAGGYVTIDNI